MRSALHLRGSLLAHCCWCVLASTASLETTERVCVYVFALAECRKIIAWVADGRVSSLPADHFFAFCEGNFPRQRSMYPGRTPCFLLCCTIHMYVEHTSLFVSIEVGLESLGASEVCSQKITHAANLEGAFWQLAEVFRFAASSFALALHIATITGSLPSLCAQVFR